MIGVSTLRMTDIKSQTNYVRAPRYSGNPRDLLIKPDDKTGFRRRGISSFESSLKVGIHCSAQVCGFDHLTRIFAQLF